MIGSNSDRVFTVRFSGIYRLTESLDSRSVSHLAQRHHARIQSAFDVV
ncbi:hypothetical protein [Rhodopirellula sp. MGV]|nr:hypothetical protein [Rhodopirellula sp. MGV]